MCLTTLAKHFLKDFIYLERGEGGEKEMERNICVCLPLVHPQLGTWPTTQACALSGNRTGNPLVHWPALSPLSPTSQGLAKHCIHMLRNLCWISAGSAHSHSQQVCQCVTSENPGWSLLADPHWNCCLILLLCTVLLTNSSWGQQSH